MKNGFILWVPKPLHLRDSFFVISFVHVFGGLLFPLNFLYLLSVLVPITVLQFVIKTKISGLKTQDNNDILAYWLSNASTLLLLLQRTLKASGAAGMAPQRRRSSSATLFGRMTQVT